MRYKKLGALLALGTLCISPDLHADKRNKKSSNRMHESHQEGVGIGQGYPKYTMQGGYSAPARIDTQCSWDVKLGGSFLLWHVSQEGMDVAFYDNGESIAKTGLINQKFRYKPGFKIEAATFLGFDNWEGKLAYTRLHSTTILRSAPPQTTSGSIIVNAFSSNVTYGVGLALVKSTWKCNLDVIDGTMSRPCYLGEMLTADMYMGPRAGFLDQELHIRNKVLGQSTFTPSDHESKSWFFGPRVGTKLRWLIGSGVGITGDFSGSLVYQRQRVKSANSVFATPTVVSTRNENVYAGLRPIAGASFGFDFGTYLMDKAMHMRVAAAFQMENWWQQNGMRQNADSTAAAGDSNRIITFNQAGSLMNAGLTLAFNLDF